MNRPARRPWLFLDLDGVVSPVPPQSRKEHVRRHGPPAGYVTWPDAIYDMYVDERLLDWARQLDQVYDVIWCSGWGETLLPAVAKPLGLDRWPVLSVPLEADRDDAVSSINRGVAGKARAIARHLEQHPRPFAWCDDYLDRRSVPQPVWSLRLPHLLIRPNARKGLTPGHVETLLEFGRQHKVVSRIGSRII
jgi:hypothetical protein